MTIDERLDRLTERHEALTHTVELLVLGTQSTAQGLKTLSHDVDRMRNIMDDVLVSIARLAHIADIHEKRLSHLEDGEKAS